MQILTLLGSPRKHGNTEGVLRRFETAASDAGHAVTRVNVIDYEVAGCLGCDNCQGVPEDFGCVQADDAEELLGQIRAADLVVYAAGVYAWGFPAQLKALLDRHYCSVKWEGEVATRLLTGKRAALLLTCGGEASDNADLTLPAFEREMDYVGGVIGGMYVLDNCSSPREDAPRAEELARRMAAELLG